MNRVTLYIAGQEVELSDDTLILYNYKLEDMSNPTVVENSYSQSVSIQGTPNNNYIFGNIWRLDHSTMESGIYAGPSFDAMRKTPFTIEDSTGAQIESGYVKLTGITIDKNGLITYKVTLYGGLGSYLYGLQYKESGDKMTLADLQYLDTGDSAGELTFLINKTNVASAWSAIPTSLPTSFIDKWQVINFAPAYNGIPSNNFDADKALIKPADHGLSADVTEEEDGVTTHYTPRGGYALMTMSEEHTEWHCKDLRSYLQRPVISVAAFLNALTKSVNSNGFTVDISAIKNLDYAQTWITLPMLPDLGTFKQTSGSVTATIVSAGATTSPIATINLTGASSLPSGATMTAQFNVKMFMTISGVTSSDTILAFRQTKYTDTTQSEEVTAHVSVGFAQLVAYDSDNNIIKGSNIVTIGDIGLSANAKQCASARGFTPVYSDETTVYNEAVTGIMKQTAISGSTGTYEFRSLADTAIPLVFSLEATDVYMYRLHCTFYAYVITAGTTESRTPSLYSRPVVYPNTSVYVSQSGEHTDYESNTYGVSRNATDVISYTSSDYLRSNAVITKAMLLTTDNTPADYLLSLCKTFGWYFVYDQIAKKVTIKTRNGLFSDTIVDLTDRIDRTKGLTITPYAIESKWYEFAFDSAGGQFADTYEESTGRVYGLKRINTGYQFNSDKKDLLDSVVFKGAVPTLETNKYNNTIMDSSKLIPSVFLDADNQYTMWATDGTSLDIDISQPLSSLTRTWFNAINGYDIDGAWKMQFHGDDNSAGEGDNVLLFYNGKKTYQKFKLSDDLPEMNQVNDGVPCWILGFDSANPTLDIPCFCSYKTSSGGTSVTKALDFGVPMELNIPNISYTEDKTIYDIAWKDYLTDKYHKDTKVLTAYINFQGMKVDQDILRQFYYYDGAIWIINKISNYSMTTYDPCKCELVKVQVIDNYTEGQDY